MDKNILYVLSSRFVVFFEPILSIDSKKKIELSAKIFEKMGGFFDGEPTILPVPLDAPWDIPRLQMCNKEESFTYGISLARSDFGYNEKGGPNKKIKDISNQLLEGKRKLLELYKVDYGWNISRLAIITDFIIELEKEGSKYITNKFLKNSSNYHEVQLNCLRKDEINDLKINRWVRIKSMEKQKNFLYILADVNTLSEEKLNLSLDPMMAFFERTVDYIEKEMISTFGGDFS